MLAPVARLTAALFLALCCQAQSRELARVPLVGCSSDGQTSTEATLTDSALRQWQAAIDRAGKFFTPLTDEQLTQEIAPGKNRLIYLFGHLAAANDALSPRLGVGNRLHPELDAMFLTNPDRAVPLSVTGDDMKCVWKAHSCFG